MIRCMVLMMLIGCGGAPEITAVHLCAQEKFAGQGCAEDQAGQSVSSRSFRCVATVRNRDSESVRFRFLRQGEEIAVANATAAFDEQLNESHLSSDLSSADFPALPGGEWSCEATMGSSTKSATISSSAP